MDKNEMSDTPLVKKYIDSVNGMAHQSAIEIIINLEKKLEAADNRNTAMMKMGDRLIAEREGKHYTAKDKYSAAPEERYNESGQLIELHPKWVGLTGAETNHIVAKNVGYPERMMKDVENLLKEKNDEQG